MRRRMAAVLFAMVILVTSILGIGDGGVIYAGEQEERISVSDLRVNGYEQPLGVNAGKATFSWQTDCSQKAYTVTVARTRQEAKEGKGFYVSEKTSTSRTCEIRPKDLVLEDNSLYYWSVKVENQDGEESEWADPQIFITDVGEQWKSTQGIWISDTTQAGALGNYMFARDVFQISRADEIEKAVISLVTGNTVSGGENVYLNGAFAGTGAGSNGSTYRQYDVTGQIQEGENTLGILAWEGAGKTFLCQLTVYYQDGSSNIVTNSGSTEDGWKTLDGTEAFGDTADAWAVSNDMAAIQNIKSSAFPAGWLTAAYTEDGRWLTPVQTGEMAVAGKDSDSAAMTEQAERCSPVSVTDQGDGVCLIDFGKEISGSFALENIAISAPVTLQLRYGTDGQDGTISWKYLTDTLDRETWTIDAAQARLERAGIMKFRYVEITTEDGTAFPGTALAENIVSQRIQPVIREPEEETDESGTEKEGEETEEAAQQQAVQSQELADEETRTIYFDNQLSRLSVKDEDPSKEDHAIEYSLDKGSTWQTMAKLTKEECPEGENVCTENLWKAEISESAAKIRFRGYYYMQSENGTVKKHYPTHEYTTVELEIPEDTAENCFYGAPIVSQLSAIRRGNDVVDWILGGHWGKADEINTIGDSSNMVKKEGTFQKDETKYYGNASFYDYYSDYELWGKKLSESDLTRENPWQDQPLFSWNSGISNYYAGETTVNPLYFGGSRMLGGDPEVTGITLKQKLLNNHQDNISFGNGAALVKQRNILDAYNEGAIFPNMNLLNPQQPIDAQGNLYLKNSSVAVPYFNESFLRGDNAEKVAYGSVYHNVSFPFTMSKNGYWTYDSSTDQGLRLCQEANSDKYYLKEQGQVKYKDKAFFFPFNDTDSYGEKSVQNIDYMFGMNLDIPFALDSDRQIKTTGGEERDCVFTFSGDDDVWIFLEDEKGNRKLVLDLGGSHGAVAGAIDFKTGIVATSGKWGWDTDATQNLGYDKDTAYAMSKDEFITFMEGQSSGEQGEIKDITEAKTYIDKKFYQHINKDSETGNENQRFSTYCNVTTLAQLGIQLQSYHNYKLNIYYMERGLDESNLRITFSFPDVKTVQVEKEWQDGIEADEHTQAKVSLYEATTIDQTNATATVTKADVKHIGGDTDASETDPSRSPDAVLNKDNNWFHAWKNLTSYDNVTTKTDEYHYFVAETDVPAGYETVYTDENGKSLQVYELQVEENETTKTIKGVLADDSTKVIIKNIRKGSVTVKKKDEKGAALEGVTFTLTEASVTVGEDGAETWTETSGGSTQEATTDTKGTVQFKDLTPGHYFLKETKTKPGLSLLKDPVQVTIPFQKDSQTADADQTDSNPVTWGDITYYFDLTYEIRNDRLLSLPVSGTRNYNSLAVMAGTCCIVFAGLSAVTIRKYKKNGRKGKGEQK